MGKVKAGGQHDPLPLARQDALVNGARDWTKVQPQLVASGRPGAAWDVATCPAFKSAVKLTATEQGIQVPDRVLRQDWLVQQHELTHVADMSEAWPLPKDKQQRRFFKMLCEVAVEAISLHRNGIDIRQARDHLDWTKFPLPDDADLTGNALLWLQVCFSADAARNPAIKAVYTRWGDLLGDDWLAWLVAARDAVGRRVSTDGRCRPAAV
jgi:hypothetical protein